MEEVQLRSEMPQAAESTEKSVKKPFKVRWGIVCGACAILVFYLTVAFTVSWMILDKIAAQTSHSASPFGTWWQVLLFVFDIVFALGIAASVTMMVMGKVKRGKQNAGLN